MITFESFKPDLTTDQWHFAKEEAPVRLWVNPYRDFMQQRLILEAPGDLPLNYPNLEAQRAQFDALAKQENFSVVAVENIKIQNAEGFTTLFKFKNPNNQMGHRILGTVMLTFDRFFCSFHFQGDEQGTTGEREAMVYALLKVQGKLPAEFNQTEKQPPQRLNSMEEYFDMVKARPALPHFSDDEQYDEAFPNHPLSRVRRYMKHLLQTIDFDDEVKRAEPFHGPEWKPQS